MIANQVKELKTACDNAASQGADQAELTKKQTDIPVLTNKQEIAERKHDNVAQRIQQSNSLRTPTQAQSLVAWFLWLAWLGVGVGF